MNLDAIVGSLVTNLVSSLIFTTIQLVAHRLARTLTDDEKRELEQVYGNAFRASFAQILSDVEPELRSHVGELLTEFVKDTTISEQLISMALMDQEPDLAIMYRWFDAQDYDLITLPVEPEAVVQSLISNLAAELQQAARSSTTNLFNLVSIGLLKQLLAQQERASANPSIFEIARKTSRGLIAPSLRQTIARDALLEKLYQFSLAGNGVVVGQPGVGKSFVLHKLSQNLIARGHACICLSVAGNQSRADLTTVLGINVDLIEYLKTAVVELGEDVGIVLIDGYDAARSTESRIFFKNLLGELIREFNPHWHVIVSVRTYDARKSPSLLDLFPVQEESPLPVEFQLNDIRCRHFMVPLLTWVEVHDAISKIDGLNTIYSNSSEGFRQLLRFPFNLWLVDRLLRIRPSRPELSAVTSEIELLSLYWERRIEDHELSHQMVALLTLLAQNMVDHLNLVVRRETLFAFPQFTQVIDDLLSMEILRYSSPLQHNFEFAHNILFDYAVARLQIPDSPDGFVDFFSTDYFKPLFLLPSIAYYFSYLWLNQPDLFWQVFWRIFLSDVPLHLKLFARLVPPRIIVSQLENLDQIAPLVEALTMPRPNASTVIASVLRMVLAHGVDKPTIWSDFLNSIVDFVAMEFVVDFAKVIDELIKIGSNEGNDTILSQCGSMSRSLADWILAERDNPTRSWFDRVGSHSILPLILKTFKTDIPASRLLLQKIIELTRDRAVPLAYLRRIVDSFDEIIAHDPELVATIFRLVFLSGELGDGSPFVGGIVVQLVMPAKSERETLEHQLVNYYPRFLQVQTAAATAVGMDCINFIVIRDHLLGILSEGSTVEDLAQTIHFHHGEAAFLSDYSYSWASIRTPNEYEPISMVEDMFDHIARLASENRLDENELNALLDLFRKHAQVAYLWVRLLAVGTRYPELFANPLFELIINDPILYGDDTIYQLGGFLEVAPQYYSRDQMGILERAIIAKTKTEERPRRLEALIHRRNRLLARIPRDRLVTDEAKQLIVKIDASQKIYGNEPLVSYTSYSEIYDEDKELAEQGIDLQSDANQRIRNLYIPLRDFNEHWSNGTPDKSAVEAALPSVRELFFILSEGSLAVHQEVVDLAWTHLAASVERMCHSVKDNNEHFDTFKKIILACAKHRLPEPNPEYEVNYNFPSWSRSPRTSAAQGLLTLAYYKEDPDVFSAIEKLARDPVPSVRYLIAWRLSLTFQHSPSFFWSNVKRILESEKNPVVLKALHLSVAEQRVRETEEAQDHLQKVLNDLLVTEPEGDLIEQLIAILPWYMFVIQAEWALQLSSRIVEDPIKLAKVFAHLAFRVLDPIKPDVLFSEEGNPVAHRAIQWTKNAIEVARVSIIELLRITQEKGWTDDVRNNFQHLQRIIDSSVHHLYFKADIRDILGTSNGKPRLTDDERRRYYFAIKNLLVQLSQLAINDTLGIMPAHTAHQFVELMNGVLKYDPADVLQMAADIVKSGKASGYQYDVMAVREVISMAEILLTDYQDILRDNTALANLLELLNIFAEAGWSEALELVGRLPELTR